MKAPENTVFPVLVPKNKGPVKIYRVQAKGVELYQVYYTACGRVQRRAYAHYEKALRAAKAAAKSLENGESAALVLKDKDRSIYVRAVEFLQGLKIDVDVAARDYAAAVKILGPGVSLVEAAREYKARHAVKYEPITVEKLVGMLLAAKKAGEQTKLSAKKPRQASERYLYDLKTKLEAFAGRFRGPVSVVTTEDINGFLGDLGKEGSGGRTLNNYRAAISVLFEYAKFKGYLPPDNAVMERVALRAEEDFEIEIYKPEEMALLLNKAADALKPCLAISAFAGLRSAEVCRLDWEEINFTTKLIEVKAAKAKTGARRLVPMPDNLIAWLKPFAGTGKVWPYVEIYMFQLQAESAEKAKLKWRHNAARHSWFTYRLAMIQNAPQVALEGGNTPAMVFAHYRELATVEQAKAWFEIMPNSSN